MNISIGIFKVNYISGTSGVNVGTTFYINPNATTHNQIGTQNNGDGNTLVTHNPIHDPDLIDSPSNTVLGYY